jgi:hypothetical protein
MRKFSILQGTLPGSRLVMLILFVAVNSIAARSQNNSWTDISSSSLETRKGGDALPTNFRALQLDVTALKSFLSQVPLEKNTAVRHSQEVIGLPMPDGSLQTFRVVESPIMEQALADKYPDIKTYSGQGISDPSMTVRFSQTLWGFHAIVVKPGSFVFIEPNIRGNTNQYISYYQKDMPIPADAKFCGIETATSDRISRTPLTELASGTQLRTYRLAMAAAGEYTALNGGTVATALAALTITVNQVDAIWEREVAIRFVLVGNNNLIIYTDATTDPYTNTAGSPCSTNIRAENQGAIDGQIGLANYDIGHLFIGTNIGGCAAGSVVCGASKAWGVSGVRTGSAFDIGLTAHEMGHQFSAQHTFNSNIGTCLGGQYAAGAAYEPGSGTTIMSYAGTCHDLQGFRDMLFHTFSYQEIITFSVSGGGNGCPVVTNTGNGVPTVNAGPSGFVIPISTPFTLTGSGSDPNGDPLTFSWEEFDLGPQGAPNNPSGTAPIFRSFPPVNSASRTFPRIQDIINNTQTTGEILPSYGRALNFRLTARDNRANGGGVEWASMSMTVDGASGPFLVTSPNSAVSWCPGTHTVTWDVANTNVAPVNVANVKISLSTDGGNTFPTVLLASTPNDGSANVNIPCVFSTQARIKVEAVGNVFFDISNVNFTTGDNTDPTFTAPPNITINKDANCNYNASTTITGDVTDEADNCDNTLNATFTDGTEIGSCDGETRIYRTWTLTDDCGNTTSHVQEILVTDITPPTFTEPADITIYKDANCDHDASVGVTGDVTNEDDNCDNTLDATFTDVTVDGSCIGELFITRTWSLSDDCGNTTTHDQLITVRDTTRPSITGVSPDPAVLWPPNHKMRDVTINYTAVDNCSPVTNSLSVTSNEPVDGDGDGNTAPDWVVVNDTLVQLRAERSGTGNGRIYTITITSTDDCGNVATTTTTVTVPHNMGGRGDTESWDLVSGLKVSLYPNPTRTQFNLLVSTANEKDPISLQVVDILGKVKEVRSISADRTVTIGSDLPAGMYILRVMQGTTYKEVKLVKLAD